MATEFRCTAILDLYSDHDELDPGEVQSSLTEHLDRVLSTFQHSPDSNIPLLISIETVSVIDILPL